MTEWAEKNQSESLVVFGFSWPSRDLVCWGRPAGLLAKRQGGCGHPCSRFPAEEGCLGAQIINKLTHKFD